MEEVFSDTTMAIFVKDNSFPFDFNCSLKCLFSDNILVTAELCTTQVIGKTVTHHIKGVT